MENNFNIKNIRAIIGLGNPGAKYYKNRHSIGFRIIDELANNYNLSWQEQDKFESTTLELEDQKIYLIKPLTFMNNSGQVLNFLLKKGIKPEEILVIHDELEKKFGQTNFKFSGSARGHNGLKSIINIIGQNFWRLRFGINRPEDQNDVPEYVLTNFTQEEEIFLKNNLPGVSNLITK